MYNYVVGSGCSALNKEPSVAVPGMAYEVKDLLDRHKRGLLTDQAIGRDPIYLNGDLDDLDVEKFRDMDKVDRDEYFESVRAANDKLAASLVEEPGIPGSQSAKGTTSDELVKSEDKPAAPANPG